MADAASDIFPRDIEDPAAIENTAHDDVGMSMAGVVMFDCDPVQTTLKEEPNSRDANVKAVDPRRKRPAARNWIGRIRFG